jgi:tRNA C32,U32 (ribose-2'-O)-methylase TrmJ
MATTAMMVRSIHEPDEPKAKAVYQNLRNLVERAAVQQDEVDRRQHTSTESHGTHTASSWSKGVHTS